MPKPALSIENHLAKLRQVRGISAADLGAMAGVTRQTIYAMEAGSYVPNTAVALKLARALEVSVEDLFALAEEGSARKFPTQPVVLLPGSDAPQSGQPVQLCRVDSRLIASAPSPVAWYLPASDAVVVDKVSRSPAKAKVQVFHPDGEFEKRILIAGCDPGISVLARHVQSAGVELVLAHRNSTEALALLKEGCVHVAGTHLRDETSGESNIPEIGRRFPKSSVAAISFAVWEEGIVVARGNPKSIRGIADFARADVAIVNRDKGAGSRLLLDSHLKRLAIDRTKLRGYERIAEGHLPAAWQVHSGEADACVATRGAARVFGLGFLPLVSERYDLVIRRQHLDLPGIQTMLDVLGRSSFRRQLESLGGYETGVAGQRML
jgi:molybdate-binding protein/DNA-binding XRE family transcriptional regulator